MYSNNIQLKYKHLEHNIHRTAEGTATHYLQNTSVTTALVQTQIKIPVFTLAGLTWVNNNGTFFRKSKYTYIATMSSVYLRSFNCYHYTGSTSNPELTTEFNS
jgi:hypothetical protein